MEVSLNKLNLPRVEVVQFKQNFIKTAVCELRFPTLLEYETVPPIPLQKLLRKNFPHYQPIRSLSVDPSPTVEREKQYQFQSKKRDWTVSFKASSIALETTRYKNFEDFSERLTNVVTTSLPVLDTDFFTRVGLRYINEIPLGDSNLFDWVREDLVTPLAQGTYGTVERFTQEVRGYAKKGRYTFRHGIGGLSRTEHQIYTLDFDFYEEDVPAKEVQGLVSEFNEEIFRFFLWAIGPETWKGLGKSTPRKAR